MRSIENAIQRWAAWRTTVGSTCYMYLKHYGEIYADASHAPLRGQGSPGTSGLLGVCCTILIQEEGIDGSVDGYRQQKTVEITRGM